MISSYTKFFCKEDISLIENYKQAVNDKTQIWDCHHRKETDLGLSRDELKEQSKYFKVPANELIFLTHAEHARLHQSERMKDPNKRKRLSEERKHKISISSKDRIWMNNGITRVFPKTQEEIDYYTSLGYHPGFKLK